MQNIRKTQLILTTVIFRYIIYAGWIIEFHYAYMSFFGSIVYEKLRILLLHKSIDYWG